MSRVEAGAISATARRSELVGWERLGVSLRIALRELRSGIKGFGIFLLCLILGVAALAGVRSVSSAIDEGLAGRGQIILGADAEFALIHREAGEAELSFLRQQGTVGQLATMRAMVRAVQGDERALVELKAVDGLYPLFGAVKLEGSQSLDDSLKQVDGRWGVVADPILLTRIGAKPGDLVKIGEVEFEVRSPVLDEPDRLSDGLMFGPRAFISLDALKATGLVQPGSLISWLYRLRLEPALGDSELQGLLTEIREKFPDTAWRIKSRGNAAPGVQRFVDRLTLFLTLVGLTALFVGGVGIANAVGNFLDGRRRNIAILKSIGAPGRAIFEIYLIQVLVLAALGIAIGVIVGAIVPPVLSYFLADSLPLPIEAGLYPIALISAALFGLLVTLAFAIWPLGRARDLPAQALFRDADRKSTRLNSSHSVTSRMPSSA